MSILRVLFHQTFYEVKFYVDFNGLSLWDRVTGQVCYPSFQTKFTDQL